MPEKKALDGETGEVFIPDFTATISPEGSVQLRGRLPSNISRDAVEAYAKSLFVGKTVYVQTRLDSNLPDGWPMRVLGGLEALGQLNYGVVIVEPDEIKISGVSGSKETAGKISRILSVRVGSKGIYKISAKYNEKFAPKPKIKSESVFKFKANIEIILDGLRKKFIFENENSNIVDAAQSNGIDVPFSCKGGMCCTCRCKITKGEVTMNANYSLEDWEINSGFVLACQAVPKSKEVILDFDAS